MGRFLSLHQGDTTVGYTEGTKTIFGQSKTISLAHCNKKVSIWEKKNRDTFTFLVMEFDYIMENSFLFVGNRSIFCSGTFSNWWRVNKFGEVIKCEDNDFNKFKIGVL